MHPSAESDTASATGTSGTFPPSPAERVAAPSRPVASAAREVREPCAETPVHERAEHHEQYERPAGRRCDRGRLRQDRQGHDRFPSGGVDELRPRRRLRRSAQDAPERLRRTGLTRLTRVTFRRSARRSDRVGRVKNVTRVTPDLTRQGRAPGAGRAPPERPPGRPATGSRSRAPGSRSPGRAARAAPSR